MDNLKEKIKIVGIIELKTGLFVGGPSTTLDIGKIDANVIKKPNGEPYIPGSSLKGKLRSLLELKAGKEKVCDCGNCDICMLFGTAAEKAKQHGRLIFRDSDLILSSMFNDPDNLVHNEDFKELELTYTESKWENTIDRVKSTANPRQIERVPAGVKFSFEIIFNKYKNDDDELLKVLVTAMELLEDDYLGGSGTRGYGKIKFSDMRIIKKTIEDYEKNRNGDIIEGLKNLKELREKL